MDFVADVLASPFICVGWIIVGAIAGALARQLTGAGDRSFLSDMILGLIGAFVGGIIASILGFSRPGGGIELVIVNLVIAVICAVILIAIGRAITGNRAVG